MIEELQRRGAVRDDDLVIITKGDLNGVSGGTNVMKIVRVGEHILPGGELILNETLSTRSRQWH